MNLKAWWRIAGLLVTAPPLARAPAGEPPRSTVVYFLHNAWWSPKQAFEDRRMQRLIERGFAVND